MHFPSSLQHIYEIASVISLQSYMFGYMNSACNPIIYALRSPTFRRGFKEIICRGEQGPGEMQGWEEDKSLGRGKMGIQFDFWWLMVNESLQVKRETCVISISLGEHSKHHFVTQEVFRWYSTHDSFSWFTYCCWRVIEWKWSEMLACSFTVITASPIKM